MQVLTIPGAAGQLVATLHCPVAPKQTVIVFVTGGNQIRAGSHRQFLLLAQEFAEAGYTTLRFDLPGLGDSEGVTRDFDANGESLRQIVDVALMQTPEAKRVVLWGLCDGATAAILYAPEDKRIAGLVLCNPWVRTAQGAAKALVGNYYPNRLASTEFWQRLMRGEVGIGKGVTDWFRNWRSARVDNPDALRDSSNLPARVAQSLTAFHGSVLMAISQHDLTGQEFVQMICQPHGIPYFTIDKADHTFSTSAHRQILAEKTLSFLASLPE